jgi:mycothiol system anti-sigma-R factor
MNCEQVQDFLYAYMDGQIAPEKRSAIQNHLRSCAFCRREVDATARLESLLRKEFGENKAPPSLWKRIANAMTEEDVSASLNIKIWNMLRWQPVPVLAAVVLLLLIILAPIWWSYHGDKGVSLIVEPVNDLIIYRLSQRPLDVASADPAVVAQWFAGKVDFALPLTNPVSAGYRLIGSRLCYFLDRRLAALMYQKGDQLMSLYVMPRDKLILPKEEWEAGVHRKISSHQLKGYNNLIWQEETLVYSLVSDLPKAEMIRFLAELSGKSES